MNRISDPYRALNLPHSATAAQIKRSYHELARKHHPDRCHGKAEQNSAIDFADVASAYALLSDPVKKARYDHIYKYGGFDDDTTTTTSRTSPPRPERPTRCRSAPTSRKRPSMGIGYTCHDPFFTYILTKGRIAHAKTVAGLRVPSRFSQTWRVALGTEFATSRRVTRTVTAFHPQGRETTRTIHHVDGTKEVYVRQGQQCAQRYVTHETPRVRPKSWWDEAKSSLTMCYAPSCAMVQ